MIYYTHYSYLFWHKSQKEYLHVCTLQRKIYSIMGLWQSYSAIYPQNLNASITLAWLRFFIWNLNTQELLGFANLIGITPKNQNVLNILTENNKGIMKEVTYDKLQDIIVLLNFSCCCLGVCLKPYYNQTNLDTFSCRPILQILLAGPRTPLPALLTRRLFLHLFDKSRASTP